LEDKSVVGFLKEIGQGHLVENFDKYSESDRKEFVD
jgi:hypothetical protein